MWSSSWSEDTDYHDIDPVSSLVQILSVIVSVYGISKETSSVKVLLFVPVRPQEPFWDLIGRVTPHQRFMASNEYFHEKKTTRSRITLNGIVGTRREKQLNLLSWSRGVFTFTLQMAHELYNAMICETYHLYNGSKDWDTACEVWKAHELRLFQYFQKSQKNKCLSNKSRIFYLKEICDRSKFICIWTASVTMQASTWNTWEKTFHW